MNAKTKNVLYGVIPRIAAVGMVGYKYGIYEAVIALLVIMAITNYISYEIEKKG
jgi:hypothetical protein